MFFYFSNTVPPTLARAERDVDYDASWSNSVVTVPAGQTQATTTVRITPKDNGVEDGGKSIGVVASDSRIGAVGISSEAFLTILDDEASSESIVLSASPATIREDAGATTVTITADLQGGVLNNDVTLVFQSDAGTAVRDVDYQRPRLTLTIPAGQTQGRGEVTITPDNDGLVEPNETIIFQVASQPQNEYGDPITVGTVTVTLTDSGEKAPPPGDTTPTFAGTVSDLSFTVGSPITPVVLPQATGDAPMSYSLSALPAGLTFNKATRTLSGTPTSPATADMVYTVIDGDASAPESAALRFTIRVRARPPDTVAVQSLTASHSSIREDGAPVAVTLTVTLAGVSAVNETVTFDFLDGTGAERDTDYDVQLPSGKSITIPAGQTKGTIGITLTPINNTKADGNRTVRIQATVSGGTATVGITITDDETQSAAITLSVRPRTISETGGRASVTVTATLAGEGVDPRHHRAPVC